MFVIDMALNCVAYYNSGLSTCISYLKNMCINIKYQFRFMHVFHFKYGNKRASVLLLSSKLVMNIFPVMIYVAC